MRKLVDLIGTKYLTINWGGEVDSLFQEHKEIDLAGARLTPTIAALILKAQQVYGVKFIDSEDEHRNSILQHNHELIETPEEPTTDIPYPKGFKDEDIVAWLRSLETDKIYFSNNYLLMIIILLARPSIKVDLKGRVNQVWDFVSSELVKDPEKIALTTNHYLLNYQNSIIKVQILEKKEKVPFHLDYVGETTLSYLFSNHMILPAYFGEVSILKDEKLYDLWYDVWKRAIDFLQTGLYESSKSLRGWLEGR